jgi:hypothetical protein
MIRTITDEQLAALAHNTDHALIGSVMVRNGATLDDLVRAMTAAGVGNATAIVQRAVDKTTDTNWLQLAAAWQGRPAAVLADILRAQHAEPTGATVGDVAIADGNDWNPLGIGWCVVRLTDKGWGLL